MSASPSHSPYGTWSSPITAEFITQTTVTLGSLTFGETSKSLYWLEGRSSEGGRNVLCKHIKQDEEGKTIFSSAEDVKISERGAIDVTSPDSNVRTRVHEYGGGAFAISNDPTTTEDNKEIVIYSNFSNQRLYKVSTNGGEEPECLTPENENFSKDNLYRFADGIVDQKRKCFICVREDHTNPQPSDVVNTIVSVSLDGTGTMKILASGNDFYTNPRLSPCGNKLAFITWNHPNMPWDSTQLVVKNLNQDGSCLDEIVVMGQEGVSVMQPLWNPVSGDLYFLSDALNGYWNIVKVDQSGQDTTADATWADKVVSVYTKDADFSGPCPGWRMGGQGFTFMSDNVVTSYTPRPSDCGAVPSSSQSDVPVEASTSSSTSSILVIITADGQVKEYNQANGLPEHFGGLIVGNNNKLFMTVSSCSMPTSIYQWCLNPGSSATLIASSMPLSSMPEPQFISTPELIKFPTGEDDSSNEVAYGYYYPPCNGMYGSKCEGELPPLLVKAHGGPTAATNTDFNPAIQFWTSRGFGVLDVDYRGSTGYGRDYRQKLRYNWGITDVEDAVAGAKYLVERGSVDKARLCIDGRSAGGLTTLGALAFKDTFTAGCSLYGVADLSALAQETHKFELKYIVGLVGRWPEDEPIYRSRSPTNALDQLNCPVLLLHGDADKIVPPNQAQIMHRVLLEKGIPTAIKIYKGEQHGFRRSENIQDALYSELYFYSKVFHFQAAGDIPTFKIDNMD